VSQRCSSHVVRYRYGELSLGGAEEVFSLVPMRGATFLDLGSGNGRLALYVALRFGVASVAGVETVPERHEAAVKAAAHLRGEPRAAPVHFVLGDYTEERLAPLLREATVVYSYNTFFEQAAVEHVGRALAAAASHTPTWFVSQQEIAVLPAHAALHATHPGAECRPGFTLRQPFYVYRFMR